MPNSDAVVMSGMMCPVRVVGRPGMDTSQMCDDVILRPSGRVTEMGCSARRLFRHGAPFVKNNDVAPVSATARDGPISMPKACCGMVVEREEAVFDETTVTSSSSCDDMGDEHNDLVGYGVE